MYLIKKGTVSIRKMKGPAFVEIARAYSSEVVGELSFFDRQPRSAAAVALTEVEVLEINFESLDKVYEKIPEYMRTIISCVAERLRKADDTIRRLQKEVVKDDQISPGAGDGPTATDVLAATGNVSASKEKKEAEPIKSETAEIKKPDPET
ncbi:MAG: hypothetical protein A2070_09675 [Bdellovibrionales bacterium GWC1_52_8]|nr:MAG: hypothetical protein A2X97_12990 [Bdellovibrionales bacterium GWA1_52_35]OFZ42677.1 MAG: hypothetical protein A2070_09675 [Bdellovibrionales bacterium GWC1_52_8]